MLFVGTSIIHPSTEGVFLLCNILDLLIYSYNIKSSKAQLLFFLFSYRIVLYYVQYKGLLFYILQIFWEVFLMDSIIFDVDGTLWDSTGIVAEAWSDYLIHTEHMDTDVSSSRLMGLFGQLLPDIAKALFPELPEAEQLRIIDGCCQAEHEALLRKCAPLYPDLEKTLKILSSRFPLFIVSNCQAGYIEVFLKSTGFGHYFKGHLCPGDTGMAKAENIMKIREDNNLSDPVYIGDTIGDFNACRKAGVPFIFAEYGFGQVDKPDYRITRPFDLTEICR